MTVRQLREILAEISDKKDVVIGYLDRNAEPIETRSSAIVRVSQAAKVCIIDVNDPC